MSLQNRKTTANKGFALLRDNCKIHINLSQETLS